MDLDCLDISACTVAGGDCVPAGTISGSSYRDGPVRPENRATTVAMGISRGGFPSRKGALPL